MTSLHHRLHTVAPTTTRSAQGRHAQVHQTIKRGILIAFNPLTYTANVLIMEATSAYLQGVPVACHLDGTSAQVNALCAVLFFDEQNYTDAVVLAVYPNGAQGIPSPAPGRITMLTAFKQVAGVAISSGITNAYQISGQGGIPSGALAVTWSASFTSSTAGAFVQLGPHGASNLGNYQTIGNMQVANSYCNSGGIIALDSTGKIDIKANGGNCTVNFYTQGYVV